MVIILGTHAPQTSCTKKTDTVNLDNKLGEILIKGNLLVGGDFNGQLNNKHEDETITINGTARQ